MNSNAYLKIDNFVNQLVYMDPTNLKENFEELELEGKIQYLEEKIISVFDNFKPAQLSYNYSEEFFKAFESLEKVVKRQKIDVKNIFLNTLKSKNNIITIVYEHPGYNRYFYNNYEDEHISFLAKEAWKCVHMPYILESEIFKSLLSFYTENKDNKKYKSSLEKMICHVPHYIRFLRGNAAKDVITQYVSVITEKELMVLHSDLPRNLSSNIIKNWQLTHQSLFISKNNIRPLVNLMIKEESLFNSMLADDNLRTQLFTIIFDKNYLKKDNTGLLIPLIYEKILEHNDYANEIYDLLVKHNVNMNDNILFNKLKLEHELSSSNRHEKKYKL